MKCSRCNHETKELVSVSLGQGKMKEVCPECAEEMVQPLQPKGCITGLAVGVLIAAIVAWVVIGCVWLLSLLW